MAGSPDAKRCENRENEGARILAKECVERADDEAGVLYVVGTPIGNLEDITIRATKILASVDIIAAEDTRSAARLLSHLEIARPSVISFFQGNEASRTQTLLEQLKRGQSVAIVSESGMPGICDPGQRFVAAAVSEDIRVEVIPGPVAAIAALVGSGLPTRPFLFLGFPPRAVGDRQELFGRLRGELATLVLYESAERVHATLSDLLLAFGPSRRCVLARELTKLHEEYVRSTLEALVDRYAEVPPRGQCTLIIEGTCSDVTLSSFDIERELISLLRSGLGPKDAAQRLVVRTGKPRRQLYQLALSLQRSESKSSL